MDDVLKVIEIRIVKKLFLITAFLFCSCTQVTESVWEEKYSQDQIFGSYSIPSEGLVILAEKNNYLITENFEEIKTASENYEINLSQSRFELSPTGYFTGTLRVIKKGGQEDIKFSGQTIEITNKNDLIAQNRKYEKFIRYRITESPMKRVRQIISTPVSLSLDATGTAIVSAAGVILFPVIVFSGVGRWKM